MNYGEDYCYSFRNISYLKVLDTLQFGETDDYTQFITMLTLNQQRADKQSSLSNLIDIVKILRDLSELKNKFKIR